MGVDWHYEHICVASTAACVGGVSIETRSLLRRPDSSVDALEAAGKKKKKKETPKNLLRMIFFLSKLFLESSFL